MEVDGEGKLTLTEEVFEINVEPTDCDVGDTNDVPVCVDTEEDEARGPAMVAGVVLGEDIAPGSGATSEGSAREEIVTPSPAAVL